MYPARIALILLLTFWFYAIAQAQEKPPQDMTSVQAALTTKKQLLDKPTPSQEELTRAQTRLATSQKQLTDKLLIYYEEQNQKLQEKSFWAKVWDEPANTIGVIGAFTAALTFYLNYRAQQRIQRDTTFYEALERYGDKDSATLRASSAGLLGQMAQEPGSAFWHHPYLVTAVNQLVTGTLLEKDPVVRLAIEDSLRYLAQHYPRTVTSPLVASNRVLFTSFTRTLAQFMAGKGAKSLADCDAFWLEAETVTGYRSGILCAVAREGITRQLFSEELGITSLYYNELTDAEKSAFHRQTRDDLYLAADRLRANIRLIQVTLPRSSFAVLWLLFVIWPSRIPLVNKIVGLRWQKLVEFLRTYTGPIRSLHQLLKEESWVFRQLWTRVYGLNDLSETFLANADFSRMSSISPSFISFRDANLMDANFSGSTIHGAEFYRTLAEGANLANAKIRYTSLLDTNLRNANIEGAMLTACLLSQVDLTDAHLFGTSFSKPMPCIFRKTEWWKASFEPASMGFLVTSQEEQAKRTAATDTEVMWLSQNWGTDLPTNPEALHPSVAAKREAVSQPAPSVPSTPGE